MMFRKLKNKRKDNQVRVMSGEEFIRDVLKWEVDVEKEPEPKKKQGRTFCLSDLTDNDIEPIDNPENYREFKNKDEAEQWGRNIYDLWGQEVKRFENVKRRSSMFSDDNPWVYSPLQWYCGEGYKQINKYYRTGRSINDKYKYMAIRISEELLLAPRIPENIVLYRYVDEEFMNELINATKNNKSKRYYEKGFMSTSLLKSIIKDAYDKYERSQYAPSQLYLLKLYVDKGTAGAYVNSIVKRDEFEMLLQNNLFLQICKKPYYDHEYKIMIVECKTRSFVTEY